MPADSRPLVVCDDPAPGVRVVRFVRPNMRDHLYDDRAAIDESPLYLELRREAVDAVAPGGAVVLNFALIDTFNSAFFRLLIRLNQDVQGKGGRLVFCCLTPIVREGFDIMAGDKTFPGQVRGTEGRAVFDAKQAAE